MSFGRRCAAISLRNRGRASERALSRLESPSPLLLETTIARPLWLGERAKERRQGLGWLAFKVACRAQSPDLSPPQISSALRSSLSHSLLLSLALSLPPSRGEVLFLPVSLPPSALFDARSSSRDARRPARSPASRDPRVQHRFSHKNSLRSTLSLGYYFLPGTAGVKSDARRGAVPFRSRNSLLCKCTAKEDRAPYARYRRARNEEARAEHVIRASLPRVYVSGAHLRTPRRAREIERSRSRLNACSDKETNGSERQVRF